MDSGREAQHKSGEAPERGPVVVLAVAAAAVLFAFAWLPRLYRSLWIDELGSFWTVSESLSDTIERSWTIQGQGPLTYVLMWAWRHLPGSESDAVLRLLPMLFGLGSLVVVFHIAKRLGGRNASWISLVVFLSVPALARELVNLRPYAFGFFFTALATLVLLEWDQRQSGKLAVGYAVLMAAAVWSSYHFGFAFLAHLGFAFCRRKSSDRYLVRFGAVVAMATLLVLPLVVQLAGLFARRGDLRYDVPLTVERILVSSFPLHLVLIVVVIAIVWRHRIHFEQAGVVVLLGGLTLIPWLVLVLLAGVAELGAWADRYKLASLLGVVVLVAVYIGRLPQARQQILTVFMVATFGIFAHTTGTISEDWRQALTYVASETPSQGLVVMAAGFVEADQAVLLDEGEVPFVAAPLSRYPVPQRVVIAPLRSGEGPVNAVLSLVESQHPTSIAVTRTSTDVFEQDLLTVELIERGYVVDAQFEAPGARVMVLVKP